RRVLHKIAIKVFRTIVPPRWAALTQSHFGRMNGRPRSGELLEIFAAQGIFDCATSGTQFLYQRRALRLRQTRVARPPKAPSNNDVSPIWCSEWRSHFATVNSGL